MSELMAVAAPTKQFVDSLFFVYDVLLIAFGVGAWRSGAERRHSRMTGALLVGVGAVGLITRLYFPMNQRAPAGTTSDAPHVVLTAVISLFIIAAVVAGSTLHGKKFRLYSRGTLATIVVFGALGGPRGSSTRRARANTLARRY